MDFSIEIKKSSNTTVPKIKILSSNKIRVIAPFYFSKHACNLIVEHNREWIEKNLEIVLTKENEALERFRANEGKVLLFDSWIDYEINPKQRRKFIYEEKVVLKSKDHLKDFYKSQGEKFFKVLADLYSQRIGAEYGKITLRWQKSIWGSCSRSGNLSFNLKLLKAPKFVGEYVVAHEIAHIKVKNHSRDFYDLLDSMNEKREEATYWLRINDKALHLAL